MTQGNVVVLHKNDYRNLVYDLSKLPKIVDIVLPDTMYYGKNLQLVRSNDSEKPEEGIAYIVKGSDWDKVVVAVLEEELRKECEVEQNDN